MEEVGRERDTETQEGIAYQFRTTGVERERGRAVGVRDAGSGGEDGEWLEI